MKVTSQFIKFDDEDNDNKDQAGGTVPFGIRREQHDNLLFLCYYEYYDQGNSGMFPVQFTLSSLRPGFSSKVIT